MARPTDPAPPLSHQARRRRASILTYVGVFAVTFLIFALFATLGGNDLIGAMRRGAPAILGDAAIGLALFPALRLGTRLRPAPRWLMIAAVAVGVAMGQSLWDVMLGQAMATVAPGTERAAFLRVMPLNTYHTGLLVALLSVQTAYFTILEQQRALSVAREGERAARLASLRFQLNPHFLFNTMNALSGLVVTKRNADAETMIERLTGFLRAALAADPAGMVSLAEEFDMLEAYLDIEHVRFGERLVSRLDLAPSVAATCIPPFLLQPLVENAMKHGVAATPEQVTVTVTAAPADDGTVLLTVEDDGRTGAMEGATGMGLGLANVRTRLRLEYGPAAILEAGSRARGYRVTIALPRDAAGAG